MATITTHKRANVTGLDEEGGIRKKLKVECEVQEDGTCEILDTDDAEITLEGELLVGMVNSYQCRVTNMFSSSTLLSYLFVYINISNSLPFCSCLPFLFTFLYPSCSPYNVNISTHSTVPHIHLLSCFSSSLGLVLRSPPPPSPLLRPQRITVLTWMISQHTSLPARRACWCQMRSCTPSYVTYVMAQLLAPDSSSGST